MKSVREHLRERHVDLDLHTVWVDEEERVATFPLWNLSNQLVGYQAYRPGAPKVQKNDEKGRYYTFRGEKLVPKKSKTVTVWGLESWNLSNELYLLEGIFDAARLTEKGYAALAILTGTPDTSFKCWLGAVKQQRPVYSVCDFGTEKMKYLTHRNYTMPEDFDMGDATSEYVDYVVERLNE